MQQNIQFCGGPSEERLLDVGMQSAFTVIFTSDRP